MNQLTLFDDIQTTTEKRVPRGGSKNPIVFRDYESFVAKFNKDMPKTTDECWTPPDVYEAVVRYVGTITDLKGHDILRPFYPGGDYINAEYPEGGVVIDNPPFSMFTKIVRFYASNGIPFFLFGNGMTIMQCCKWSTAVIINKQIKFENGAMVRVNFASNLYGDALAVTAPKLGQAIAACPSQQPKTKSLPKYVYPREVVSTSLLQIVAGGGVELRIDRKEGEIINDLDNHPNGLFGSHLLVSREAAERASEAAERAREAAERAREAAERAREAAERAREQHIELSPREAAIVERLSNRYDELT